MSGDPSDQQISADGAWQFCQPPSVSICQGFQMGSSSCPPVEPFQSSTLWNPGFSEKPVGLLHPRLDVGWNSPADPDVVARLGMFSGANPGMLPPSLSNFAVDSSFFERSARFSNFSSAGGFGAVPSPFGTSGASEVQIQNSEGVRGVSVSMDDGSRNDSPIENHRDNVVSEETSPGFVNASGDSSSKGLSTKKRKKTNQGMELDPSCPQFSAESPMENVEAKKKVENNSATQAAGKSTGKNAKGSSDLPKEDYIHLRARCGQATNSHSLAERVRRERISQRMKYLQDLVPGCNKVTGKAVMLDEIINYVQSLQRQIEFLSMKLATVNPSVDLNIEGLLSKDLSLQQLLQSRGGPSTMGVSQELLLHPQLLSSQQCLIETGIPELQTSLMHNAQFSTVNGFKEPSPQIPNQWDTEINNVM